MKRQVISTVTYDQVPTNCTTTGCAITSTVEGTTTKWMGMYGGGMKDSIDGEIQTVWIQWTIVAELIHFGTDLGSVVRRWH
jgi:hypothetical protein